MSHATARCAADGLGGGVSDPRATIGIVGGGPAGSALAIRLQRLGHAVLIVTDGRCRYGLQGLSERAIAALRALNAPRAMQTIGPPSPRLVLWNGGEAQPNDEYLIDRRDFDRALLTDAEDAGAHVVFGTVRSKSLPASGPIAVVGRASVREVRAATWIEARGRSALRSCRPTASGPPTLTLQQRICPAVGRSWSAVIALEDGWSWMATCGDGYGIIQRSMRGGRGRTPLSRSIDLRRTLPMDHPNLYLMLKDARTSGPVQGYATETALQIGDPSHLRVGDALTAPDPLSGHGVCEAIANSRNLAAAVNTVVRTPDSAELAHRFVAERARERYSILCTLGLHSYRQEQRWMSHEFWLERRTAPLNFGAPVQTQVEIRRAPVLEHDQIVLREILILPQHPRGIWRVHDVPVVELMTHLRAGNAPEQAAEALRVSPLQAAQAMQWIREQGLAFSDHG
jgi:flavin-dependent dehydrogenase